MGAKDNVDSESQIYRLEEALRKTQERATAGQLALEMIHEIRNPLEALGNVIYLANLEAKDYEPVQQYLSMAEEQIATVNAIATQTLNFARSTSSAKPVKLLGVAEAALRIHQRTIEGKKVRLLKDIPEQIVANVHVGEILQVISNLITNALDALPPEGTLCLRLRKHRGEVQFTIADNGHGIPKENVEQVFQPFFTTKEGSGTGLGLGLSKTIVERHKGRIRIRSSVRPGRSGTIFRISLPA